MEIETAYRRFALNDATVNGYVDGKVYKFRLMGTLDGTGGRALVVARDGQWGRPSANRTGEYPLLRVECWADHTRSDDGEMIRADGEDQALALWRAVDRLFNGWRGKTIGTFGSDPGLLVASSARWSEPIPIGPKDRPQGGVECGAMVAYYAVEPVTGS